MKLEETSQFISIQNEEQFVADALEAVKLKFVSSLDDIDSPVEYAPEFAHQHFGETEKIVGYKGLDVKVMYTDATLYLTSITRFSDKIDATSSTLKCDDVEYKVRDALPIGQLDAYLSMDKFKQKLVEQKKFRPYGELIGKFQIEETEDSKPRLFELYKLDKKEGDGRLEAALKYLERAQSIAFWYIDAVTYTDECDPRFFDFFLFENVASNGESNGHCCYKFAGYANLYRFFHYPDQDRVRISQMLVAPPYRNIGLGSRFLQAIYSDLWAEQRVFDITAETPADSFIYMRDYADCVNCAKLPQFSRVNLPNGFTKDMWESARQKYKLNKAQTRRVYEILRFFHTSLNVPEERQAFKQEVMARLKRQMMDRQKDQQRVARALGKDDQALAVLMAMDPEQQQHQLEVAYDSLLEGYKHVIQRLLKFEKEFAK